MMKDFDVFLKKDGVSIVVGYRFDENDEMEVKVELNHAITDFSKTETVGELLRFANAHQFNILKWFGDNSWNTTSYYKDTEITVYGDNIFGIENQKIVEFKIDECLTWSDYLADE